MTWRVLISCPHLQRTLGAYADWLAENDIEADAPPMAQQLSEEELLSIIERYDGVVAGDDPYTAAVLEKGTRLRVVAKWGIGVDAIDQDAAARLGIRVINTPGAFGDEVADVAVGYLILLARQLHLVDRAVRGGEWSRPPGRSLAGRCLGVVGLGNIGAALVKRGEAMGMRVVGADPWAAPEGVTRVELSELLQQADAVALCCALTRDNHHLIDDDALAKMRPGGWLINVSRGPLVDTEAVLRALDAGRLAGAALEVFEEEPLPADHPLTSRDDVILGSHNASNTEEAVARVNQRALDNLLAGLREVTR